MFGWLKYLFFQRDTDSFLDETAAFNRLKDKNISQTASIIAAQNVGANVGGSVGETVGYAVGGDFGKGVGQSLGNLFGINAMGKLADNAVSSDSWVEREKAKSQVSTERGL